MQRWLRRSLLFFYFPARSRRSKSIPSRFTVTLRMRYQLGLLAAFLTTTAANAQIITAPPQALAARDTLLLQATQLRQQVQAQTASFSTNGHTQRLRRQVVRGTVEVAGKAGITSTTRLRWRQVTRYRRNGRVQEHFLVKTSAKLIMDEYRLNGRTLRLAIYSQVPGSGNLTPHHLGRYLQSGYVVLDRKQYALPQPAN